MALEVQNFLRCRNDGLESLKEAHAINYKFHGKYPNLVQLKYDMIESPMGHTIVQECRGIILDKSMNWDVVAHPFHKFFNSDEGHAAKIEWSSARVQEKVDGSLIIMYFYDGKWHVATSGTPDASGEVNGLGMTFAELFWKTWNNSFGNTMEASKFLEQHKDYTIMWELTSPFNRIVVQHKTASLTLIGMRNRVTGEEKHVFKTVPWNFPVVKHYNLNSLEAIGESFATISALEQEGYVVVDAKFNRVKVKSPQYVALHHLRGEGGFPSPKGALSVIRQGEMGELLSYWPEWKPIFWEVEKRYQALISELEADWLQINAAVPPIPLEVKLNDKRAQGLYRKEFASLATKTRCPGIMFLLLDGKAGSVREGLNSWQIDHLCSILKLSEVNVDPTSMMPALDNLP